MKTKIWLLSAPVLGGFAFMAAATGAPAQPAIDAEGLFKDRCAACHDPAIDRAPDRAGLATRSPATIVDVLTRGVMQPMAAGMSAAEIQALADHLGAKAQVAQAPTPPAAAGGRGGGRAGAAPVGAGPAGGRAAAYSPTIVDQMCATHPPIKLTPSSWTSFGVDPANTRFQRNPGLKAADVPKLKVKWAFSIPGGSYGAPVVVGDRLFITSRGGRFYSLDAKTGCVHWRLDDVVSRTTPMIVQSKVSPSGWITYVGDRSRVVHAFDAETGKELWKSPELESHRSSGITGSPIVYKDQVFVPITSGEEGAGAAPTYSCCSFRGSLVAISAIDGKKQWQTYVIQEPLLPTRKNSAGTQQQGPAGGAIWSAPTVDAKRGLVLVATGDQYNEAPTIGSDAIIAMDMATGAIRWQTQVTKQDGFIVGCTRINKPTNCAPTPGPDFDFGSSPIIKRLPNGKDVVLSGQKSGIAYGMDADTGKLIWHTQLGTGSSLGGIEWGMAADDKYLYAPNSDIVLLMEQANKAAGKPTLDPKFDGDPKPSLSALDPATGKVVWQTPTPKAPCNFYGDRSRDRAVGCFNASSAAASVMPGVVFSGSADGWFRAYDAKDGKIIWAFNSTAQTYDTVNGVKGQPGGSIDGMGATIAGGMVYQMSGFNGAASTGGNGTNVLLAFSPDGK